MSGLTELLNQEFLGNQLSEYGLFVLTLFGTLTFYSIAFKILHSRFVDKFVGARKELYENLVGFARNPLKLILATFTFWVGVNIFDLPEKTELVIQNLFLALLAITVCYVLLKIIDAVVSFLKPKVAQTESKLDDHLLPILNTTLKSFVVLVAILLVIQNMGYNITSLLAGLGLGGLAVALAAQDTLSNVFGAIAIFVDQPFRVGEQVQLEGFSGTIEVIGVRSTRLRTFDGTLVTFPNSLVANAKIENMTARQTRRTNFTIGVTYDTSYEKLQKGVEILREVMSAHSGTHGCRAYFNSYGDFSLNIMAQHWSKHMDDYEAHLKCLQDINFEILKRFEEEGIEFAFPTQTLYVKSEDKTS